MSNQVQFPNDENGELLADMAKAGIDLSQLHVIDFFILFEQKPDAEKFEIQIAKDDLAPKTQLQKCSETGVWEVITSIQMVPDHTLLCQMEQYFESFANPLNGYGDGWGIMAEE